MISSVGIALALLGSFFVGYAALLGGGEASMLFGDLLASALTLSRPWLRAGFTLLLVGYGAKLGLVPMPPGSRTPTARRRAWWAPSWRAGSPAALSWRCCA
jgi:hypothetical protein